MKLLKTYPPAVVSESMDAYFYSDATTKTRGLDDPRRLRAMCQRKLMETRQSTYAPIAQNCNPPAPVSRDDNPQKTAEMLARGRENWYRPEPS